MICKKKEALFPNKDVRLFLIHTLSYNDLRFHILKGRSGGIKHSLFKESLRLDRLEKTRKA